MNSDEGARTAGSATTTAAGVVRLCAIRESALSVDEVLAAVADPSAGGIALFAGVVRDHDTVPAADPYLPERHDASPDDAAPDATGPADAERGDVGSPGPAGAGAVVRPVVELGYTAHPSAEAELRTVAGDVAAAHPTVRAVAATHRVGDLAVGEIAVVVGVAAPHRAEAFAACRDLIDELKARVPLWKHQRFADGDAGWVGIG